MLRKEISLFLIVGTLTVIIDFLAYYTLLWGAVGHSLSKTIGFITGSVFACFANRFCTFGHIAQVDLGSPLRFGIVYSLSLCANVLVNHVALSLLPENASAVHLAFLLATGVSASLNFLGMKFFVFCPSVSTKKEGL